MEAGYEVSCIYVMMKYCLASVLAQNREPCDVGFPHSLTKPAL